MNSPIRAEGRRPMVRYTQSPARSSTPTHNGLIFAGSGRVHNGGKQHTNSPRDHDVITPGRGKEVTPIFAAGKTFDRNVVSLPVSRRPDSPRRFERERPAQPDTPTGKKKVMTRDNGNVVAPGRSDTPDRIRAHKIAIANPPDNFIPGVSSRRVTDSPQRERPRGVKVMDGPPTFVAPAFEKRPYQPHLRKVDSRPRDNIFGSTITEKPAVRRESSPVRSGRRMTPMRDGGFNIITGQ